MINLNQSIAKVKEDMGKTPAVEITREFLIEVIMHEGAGRDRKTLLAWLNEQVEDMDAVRDFVVGGAEEALETVLGPEGEAMIEIPPMEITKVEVELPTAGAGTKITVKGIPTPVYRPEKRGNAWCLYDVNNGRMRQETFENKGDARKFIARLELDVDGLIEERSCHYFIAA